MWLLSHHNMQEKPLWLRHTAPKARNLYTLACAGSLWPCPRQSVQEAGPGLAHRGQRGARPGGTRLAGAVQALGALTLGSLVGESLSPASKCSPFPPSNSSTTPGVAPPTERSSPGPQGVWHVPRPGSRHPVPVERVGGLRGVHAPLPALQSETHPKKTPPFAQDGVNRSLGVCAQGTLFSHSGHLGTIGYTRKAGTEAGTGQPQPPLQRGDTHTPLQAGPWHTI